MDQDNKKQQTAKYILSQMKIVPDFPKKGINFLDICPMFKNPDVFQKIIDAFIDSLQNIEFDYLVCLESRGFIYGTAIALQMKKGFVLIRKPGKLPGQIESYTFEKEYGKDSFEIQIDAIEKGKKCVIVDDILATGGTANAAYELVKKVGGICTGIVFLYEIAFLKGREKLPKDINIISLSSE